MPPLPSYSQLNRGNRGHLPVCHSYSPTLENKPILANFICKVLPLHIDKTNYSLCLELQKLSKVAHMYNSKARASFSIFCLWESCRRLRRRVSFRAGAHKPASGPSSTCKALRRKNSLCLEAEVSSKSKTGG